MEDALVSDTSSLSDTEGAPALHAPAFNPAFTPSKTAKHLDPANLPIAKTRRAWEREPQSPFQRDASYNKVWRRYEARAVGRREDEQLVPELRAPNGSAKEDVRMVKKLKITLAESAGQDGVFEIESVSYQAMKWERRSSLPRKLVSSVLLSQDAEQQGIHPETLPEAQPESPPEDQNETEQVVGENGLETTQSPEPSLGEEPVITINDTSAKGTSEDTAEEQEPHHDNLTRRSEESAENSTSATVDDEGLPPCDEHATSSLHRESPSETNENMSNNEVPQDSVQSDMSEHSKSTENVTSAMVEERPTESVSLGDDNSSPQGSVDASSDTEDYKKQETHDREAKEAREPNSVISEVSHNFLSSNTPDMEAAPFVDYDTAILKDFLSRAEASKASRAASIAKRSSLSHRRDSGVVRQALASPRKVLHDKDPNSPSLQKMEAAEYKDLAREAAEELTVGLEAAVSPPAASEDLAREDAEQVKATLESVAPNTRRSARSRSRIPLLPSHMPAPPTIASTVTAPNKIPVRRVDGAEPVVLKKSEAQELAAITRTNTRRNKLGGINVQARLLKLSAEASAAATGAQIDAEVLEKVLADGEKGVRWAEQLTSYSDQVDEPASSPHQLQDEQSTSNVIARSSLGIDPASNTKQKKPHTSRIRRPRVLGAANGTPAKGLLAPAVPAPAPTSAPPAAAALASDIPALSSPPKKRAAKTPALPSLATPPSEDVPSLASPAKKRRLIDSLTSASTTSAASAASNAEALPALASPPKKRSFRMDVEAGKETRAAVSKERKSRLATPRKIKLPVPAAAAAGGGVAEGKENKLVSPKKIGALGGGGVGAARKRGARKM